MRELLENELTARRKFGCTIDDILDDIVEILETVREREYKKGYVDCAKTYQFNKMIEPREIWRVLDEISKQVDSAENYFSSAVVKFKGDWNFIDYIKNTNSLAVKVNPIKDESLKLTFDWGQLIVEIYYIEEH